MEKIVKILDTTGTSTFNSVSSLKEDYKMMKKKYIQYGIDHKIDNDRDFFKMEIIYTSILNKEAFEKHYEKLKNDLFDIWEHFEYQERKKCIDKEMLIVKDQTKKFHSANGKIIRIAFFDELLNSLYENEMIIFDLPQYFKLEKKFNTRMMDVNEYNAEPFKAGFSSCIILSENTNSYVIFNKYTKSLYYMIDNVNYLKFQFDRHKNDEHFTIDRLLPISQAILSKDPLNVIDKLQASQLCSPSINAKLTRYQRSLIKRG